MVAKDKSAALLPSKIKKYVKDNGDCPFDRWRKKQRGHRGAAVDEALDRIAGGRAVKIKSYGGKIGAIILTWPTKIRIYYGLDDDATIVLLGGDDSAQSDDINRATDHWNDYLERGKENG